MLKAESGGVGSLVVVLVVRCALRVRRLIGGREEVCDDDLKMARGEWSLWQGDWNSARLAVEPNMLAAMLYLGMKSIGMMLSVVDLASILGLPG